MVEGIVVEKEKARVAFESEVRAKRRGPAIAEHVVGNTFKSRLYPVPVRGCRSVRITHVGIMDGGVRKLFEYGFNLKEVLEEFSVSMLVDLPRDE